MLNFDGVVQRLRVCGVRAHIAFLCAACILPLLAVSLLATWRFAQAENDASRVQLVSTARALSAAIDLKLQSAFTALSALATSPALAAASLDEFYRQCAAVAAEHNAHILLVDPDGNEFFNTHDRPGPTGRRLTVRTYLERALSSGKFLVSNLVVIRDRPHVIAYLPVRQPDGRQLALLMAFETGEIARVVADQHLPESWMLSVIDGDGVHLSRSPTLDGVVGTPVSAFLRERLGTASVATFQSTSRDRRPVFGAFAKSALSGWSVVLTIPTAEVNGPLERTFWQIGLAAAAMLLLGTALAAAIGGHLARSLDKLSQAALALAEDLPWVPFRSTVREVNDVVAAHQAADHLLRQRSRERDDAEALLRDAVDSISEGFVIFDAEDRLVMCNQRYLDLYTQSAGVMVPGMRFEDMLRHNLAHGEYVDAIGREDEWLAERLRDHRDAAGTIEQHRRDGRWVMVTERRMRNGGIAGLRIDITDRKKAEAEVEAARARLADWTEAATDWFWETDADCRITFISDGFEKALGIRASAVIGQCIYSGGGAEPEGHWADVLARRPFRDILLERETNGRPYFIRISGTPVYDARGKFIGYRGTTRNVTDQIKADRALAHQSEIFSTLIGNLPIGVGLVGRDMRWMAFNRAFLQIYDLTPDDIHMDDPFEDFLRLLAERGEYGPVDVEADVRRRMAIVQRAEPFHLERTRPAGRHIEIRRVPLSGGGFVTTYIDVTAARRREADLHDVRARLERQAVELDAARIVAERARESAAAANAAKSRFLANMSHELRTPLNAILGFSEIMSKTILGPLEGPYHAYAQDIHVSGQYLLRLIGDLLDLSKIEVGQMELREEMVDVPDLASECLRLLLDKAQAGQVTMECELPAKFPLIFADRLRFKQALLNLLSNAVKFTPAGGRVDVAARVLPSDGGAVLTVSDTGIGMKAADIALALEPFRQIDNALTRRTEGTGLGLPLTKTLIEMHGGTLKVRSEPGRGTHVDIWLPPDRLVRPPAEETPAHVGAS